MSANSSFSFPLNLTSTNSSHRATSFDCLHSRAAQLTSIAFNITRIIFLCPLCALVLFVGHQRWRRQRPGTIISHADFFTYNMVVIEMIGLSGCVVNCWASYSNAPSVMVAGAIIFALTFPKQLFCHCLTCIERYLAVVHPITYLGLRGRGWVRVRYMSSGFVWLLSALWAYSINLNIPALTTVPFLCLLVISLIVVSFCSLSVLHALKSPGPGDKDTVNQSKQRAFNTIMLIMAVVLLWFVGLLVCFALTNSGLLNNSEYCVVMMCGFLLSLPSSLVLPLLFLHRVGKLPGCLYSAEQEPGLD